MRGTISKLEVWRELKANGFVAKPSNPKADSFWCDAKVCGRVLDTEFHFEEGENVGYPVPHNRAELWESMKRSASQNADGTMGPVPDAKRRCQICLYRTYRSLYYKKYGVYPDEDVPNSFTNTDPKPKEPENEVGRGDAKKIPPSHTSAKKNYNTEENWFTRVIDFGINAFSDIFTSSALASGFKRYMNVVVEPLLRKYAVGITQLKVIFRKGQKFDQYADFGYYCSLNSLGSELFTGIHKTSTSNVDANSKMWVNGIKIKVLASRTAPRGPNGEIVTFHLVDTDFHDVYAFANLSFKGVTLYLKNRNLPTKPAEELASSKNVLMIMDRATGKVEKSYSFVKSDVTTYYFTMAKGKMQIIVELVGGRWMAGILKKDAPSPSALYVDQVTVQVVYNNSDGSPNFILLFKRGLTLESAIRMVPRVIVAKSVLYNGARAKFLHDAIIKVGLTGDDVIAIMNGNANPDDQKTQIFTKTGQNKYTNETNDVLTMQGDQMIIGRKVVQVMASSSFSAYSGGAKLHVHVVFGFDFSSLGQSKSPKSDSEEIHGEEVDDASRRKLWIEGFINPLEKVYPEHPWIAFLREIWREGYDWLALPSSTRHRTLVMPSSESFERLKKFIDVGKFKPSEIKPGSVVERIVLYSIGYKTTDQFWSWDDSTFDITWPGVMQNAEGKKENVMKIDGIKVLTSDHALIGRSAIQVIQIAGMLSTPELSEKVKK